MAFLDRWKRSTPGGAGSRAYTEGGIMVPHGVLSVGKLADLLIVIPQVDGAISQGLPDGSPHQAGAVLVFDWVIVGDGLLILTEGGTNHESETQQLSCRRWGPPHEVRQGHLPRGGEEGLGGQDGPGEGHASIHSWVFLSGGVVHLGTMMPPSV